MYFGNPWGSEWMNIKLLNILLNIKYYIKELHLLIEPFWLQTTNYWYNNKNQNANAEVPSLVFLQYNEPGKIKLRKLHQ